MPDKNNSLESGIYDDPEYRPGLDESAQAALTDWGDFIAAGSSRETRRWADAWEVGQILTLAVTRFGIEVGRGRPKKDRVLILASPRTVSLGCADKPGTVTGPAKEGFMVLVDGADSAVPLPKEALGPPIMLGSLGHLMGLTSQKTSRLYLNATFYPRKEWRLVLPFGHYTVARQNAPGLESALELLWHAERQRMTEEAFRQYCAGEYYNDLWPENVVMPDEIKGLAPSGVEAEFRLVIRRKREE